MKSNMKRRSGDLCCVEDKKVKRSRIETKGRKDQNEDGRELAEEIKQIDELLAQYNEEKYEESNEDNKWDSEREDNEVLRGKNSKVKVR